MNHLSNILTALRSADNDGLQQKATWNVVRAVNIVEALLDLEYESLF
ncbi:MAG TPA: hypothetical protein VFW11_00685 [Cyclobacteriaceae bacterium]|nr:hypothetical protein [Cyclobacteriaceae bacterium]